MRSKTALGRQHFAQRLPNDAQRQPKGAQRDPKGVPGGPEKLSSRRIFSDRRPKGAKVPPSSLAGCIFSSLLAFCLGFRDTSSLVFQLISKAFSEATFVDNQLLFRTTTINHQPPATNHKPTNNQQPATNNQEQTASNQHRFTTLTYIIPLRGGFQGGVPPFKVR